MRTKTALLLASVYTLVSFSSVSAEEAGYWLLKDVQSTSIPAQWVIDWYGPEVTFKVDAGDGYITTACTGRRFTSVDGNGKPVNPFQMDESSSFTWGFTSPANFRQAKPGEVLAVKAHLENTGTQGVCSGSFTYDAFEITNFPAGLDTTSKNAGESGSINGSVLEFWKGEPGEEIMVQASSGSGFGIQVKYTWEFVDGSPPKPIPLCPEALRYFSSDELKNATSKNNLRMSQDEVWKQFETALDDYNEQAERLGNPPAYSPDKTGKAVPMLLWLFTTDDMRVADPGSWTDSDAWKADLFLKTDCTFTDMNFTEFQKYGTKVPEISEYNLAAKIKAEHDNRVAIGLDGRLNPGQIFSLALNMTKGNASDAMLLAHNTLRSAVRGYGTGLTGVNKNYGCKTGEQFEKKYLATLREGDNGGPWYHIFGTAYFEMAVQNSKLAKPADMALDVMSQMYETVNDGRGGDNPGFLQRAPGLIEYITGKRLVPDRETKNEIVSWFSYAANQAEQLWRQYKDGNNADPEKYCVNVYGQVVGRKLSALLGAPPTGKIDTTKIIEVLNSRDMFAGYSVGSFLCPAEITWTAGNKKLTMNLVDMTVSGDAPVFLIPVIEPKGQLGVQWFSKTSDNIQIEFKALGEGAVFCATADYSSGEVTANGVAVKAGDRFTLTGGIGGQAGVLVASDGTSHEPARGSLGSTNSPPTQNVPGELPGAVTQNGPTELTPPSQPTTQPGPSDDSPGEPNFEAYPLVNSDSSFLVARECPTQDVTLFFGLYCEKPGVLFDTVGINSAQAGDWTLRILDDGYLRFDMYYPGLNTGFEDGTGWHRYTLEDPLLFEKEYWIHLEVLDFTLLILSIDEHDNQTYLFEPLPTSMRSTPVYAGDYPGDDTWGSGYNIHPAAIAMIGAYYFGPYTEDIFGGSASSSWIIPGSGITLGLQ